jgi:hypothetical protein
MRRVVVFLSIVVSLLFMVGCGSQSQVSPTAESNPSPTATNVPVSLTVTDTPPAGVTVLFFQLSLTGAYLSPGNVSLLPSTNVIPVNVSQLQTDSLFLGSMNVPAGTYTSLTLTFSPNSQLTIYNGSGATMGSGSNACANDTVCQITPNPSNLTQTFSTAPFPVTLTAGSPLAFKLDIHLDSIIQPDLSVNLGATNGVTISELLSPSSGAPVPALGHLIGTVQSVNASTSPNGFTLVTGDGRTFAIDVGSSTTYSDFPAATGCSTSAETFSCLATQEIVRVEVSLQTDGTLLASEVEYVQPAGQTTVEGNIIRLSSSGGNTLMDLILQQGDNTPTPLNMGRRVTVTVPPSGVTYAVDSGNFAIPSGLTFTSASDLLVGQDVSVVVMGSLTTGSGSDNSSSWISRAAITFTTDSITLEPSQITGPVTAIDTSGLSFTLNTNPHYFVPAAIPTGPPAWMAVGITVQTTGATTFTNLNPDSIAGLADQDIVSVEGWLFPTPGATPGPCTTQSGCPPNTTIAAETVIDRPAPTLGGTPLF